MRYMVKKVADNLYEVTRSSGWWFWRREWIALAYWFTDENRLFGDWRWVDEDETILDPDVRIALCEADIKWKKMKEESKWTKK